MRMTIAVWGKEKMPRLIDADKLMQMIPTEEYNARMVIANAPTVEAEPIRHGHWILQTNGHGMCSTCSTFVDLLNGMTWEYCPICGAEMDEAIDTPADPVAK